MQLRVSFDIIQQPQECLGGRDRCLLDSTKINADPIALNTRLSECFCDDGWLVEFYPKPKVD